MKKLNDNQQLKLQSKAPGKLILSGEHAVVYGNPAIAMAINRFAKTTLSWQAKRNFITFHLLNLSYTVSSTLKKLRNLRRRAQNKYEQFLKGECTIREVLQHSFELLQYAFIHTIDKLNITLPKGLTINTNSNIPIGCGMGSSAATIVSIMHAVTSLIDSNMNLDNYLQHGRNIENLQHGHSSGLDIYISLHGGYHYFKNNKGISRPIPKVPMYLVNTGKPQVSTGQCVATTAKYFQNNNTLLNDFTTVTQNLDKALQENDIENIKECIKNNHKLLKSIGVVPKRVQQFIANTEEIGAAAKICGSGANIGEKAGAVLVVTENKEGLYSIAKKYNYEIFKIQGYKNGLQIV